jgi:hypothetical protein
MGAIADINVLDVPLEGNSLKRRYAATESYLLAI